MMSSPRPALSVEEIWRTYDSMEARLSAPLSERMLELANVGAGMRVFDLATGRGEPAIPAAHRVGPSGRVLGVDLSASMLDMARERASREGLTNLELRVMNAASLEGIPEAHFHVSFIRWGLMYMDNPVAALEGARRALLPGGVLVVAVWAEPERVPYFTLPRRVLEQYQPVPPIDLASPGTFFYADPERLTRDLQRAGLQLQHREELEIPVMEAQTNSELVAWVRAFGLARLMKDLPEQVQKRWEEDLAQEAEAYRTDGFFRLGGVTRIVVASRAE